MHSLLGKLSDLFCGLIDKNCGKLVYTWWQGLRISRHGFPHSPQVAGAVHYTPCVKPQILTTTVRKFSSAIFRHITDVARYLSTFSTPPITTTNNI